uniref:Uncharacterized protein n=1 Tax=Moniliophthora roreri TaxID=221103 RepID=A0A0W0FYF8_MONRR
MGEVGFEPRESCSVDFKLVLGRTLKQAPRTSSSFSRIST